MVKIFPAKFILEDETAASHQLWDWVDGKIKESTVAKIAPLELERSASKASFTLKCLLEVHCSENITTSELSDLLKPYPSFIQQIHLTLY